MTYPRSPFSTGRWLGAFLVTLGIAGFVVAQEKKSFDIPAGTADKSLRLFITQSGAELVYPVEIIRGIKTPEIKGAFTPREALDRMFLGTALAIEQDVKTGTLSLVRAAGPNAPRAVPTEVSGRPVNTSDRASATEEAVVLSPFEVVVASDNGYVASTTLAATRTNEKLENLPNSISVITPDLLKDIDATNYFDAVDFAVGAENTFSVGLGVRGAQRGELQGNTISFRGIPSIRQLRDGIPWYITQDTFNTERIEFSRGSGGLMYGDVDPGGIINIVSKRANFVRAASLTARADSFDSKRATADVNQPVIPRQLALRINAVDSRINSWVQRQSSSIEGVAGALRWLPGKDGKTQFDLLYENGNIVDHVGHTPLEDYARAYVFGSGTNALDADPLRSGVQTNGVGMQQIQAAGATKAYWDINGTVYNMQSTGNNVYRFAATPTTKNVASGTDPQNPLLVPRGVTPFSIVPLGQDWGGPDTRHETRYHSYTLEFRHTFGGGLNVLVTNNGQSDRLFSIQAFNNGNIFTSAGENHSVLIDPNPLLPNPNGSGTIPNPHYQDYFVTYTPIKSMVKHTSQTWRTDAVYELELPWSITERLIGSSSYRDEKVGMDNFSYALSQSAIAQRGYSGAAASYLNNEVFPIHYLKDGNSSAALKIREGPDVAFFRDDVQTNNRFEGYIWSSSVSALGSYFQERLHTSVGISRDYWRQNMAPIPVPNGQGELQFVERSGNPVGSGGIPLFSLTREYSTNQTYGAVLRLLPWVSVSGGYFESALFSDHPNNYGVSLLGTPFGPRRGTGRDYSLRFDLLQDRIYTTFTYYETKALNNFQNVNANVIKELNGLLSPSGPPAITGTQDSTDQASHGVELEMVGNPMRNWTVRATFTFNKTQPLISLPRLHALLAAAEAAAVAQGSDPNAATAVTQTFIDTTTGTPATFRPKAKNATLATRYTFRTGPLKGFVMGVSARYQMGFPVTAQLQVGGVNVIAPYSTPDQWLVNPFIAYGHRLGEHSWELRLSATNVFDRVTNQGNNPNNARYTAPREIIGSATLKF